MDWRDIKARIESGEGPNTEFERGLGDLSAIGRAICAFANSDGGAVIIGVSDSGEILGAREDADAVQERLTSFLHTGFGSPVSARLGRREVSGGWAHWIEVPRQRGFEPMRCAGRVWIRRGRASVEPSPSELQELYNAFGYILTEERAIMSATPSHIDLHAFRKYLDAMGFDTLSDPQPASEDDLRNRGVITDLGGEPRATLYGVMAFGKDPQAYPQTRDFRVDCVAYAGEDRSSDVLQVADGRGALDEQVRRSVGWFLGLGRFETYRGLLREDRWLLPEAAVREALVNAAAHRDYSLTGSRIMLETFSDRAEVSSPGALPNGMSVESVRAGDHPRSRNELMAHFMVVRRLMERRGRGWHIMRRAMREFNGSEPELQHDERGRTVKVTFRF